VTPCNQVQVYQGFRENYCHHLQVKSFPKEKRKKQFVLGFSSALKMGKFLSPETSIKFYQTTNKMIFFRVATAKLSIQHLMNLSLEHYQYINPQIWDMIIKIISLLLTH
jgi:hypothetical protein